MSASRNVAARMGHWSATHRKTAIFGWLAFVVVAFAVGTAIGTKTLAPEDAGVGESGRMNRILADDFETPAGERVMIQSAALTADSPEFRRVIEDVAGASVVRDPELRRLRGAPARRRLRQ